MSGIEAVIAEVPGASRADLERWIDNAWVRPDPAGADWEFHAIDVARVRLIVELRDRMEVDEHALPVVLTLLDRLYDERRRMHVLFRALHQTVPPEVQALLLAALEAPPG